MAKIRRVAQANLPTEYGIFKIVGFELPDSKKEHVALVMGDISNEEEPVLARIHSECLTGDALHSLKCDCGFQLATALRQIQEEGRGVLIYHREEGRGIGLINKIRAYALQDQGMDTIEANLALGFKADERNFAVCADMFELLGVKKVRLMTNNPQKVDTMKQAGINVVERVPLKCGRKSLQHQIPRHQSEKNGTLHRTQQARVLNGMPTLSRRSDKSEITKTAQHIHRLKRRFFHLNCRLNKCIFMIKIKLYKNFLFIFYHFINFRCSLYTFIYNESRFRY